METTDLVTRYLTVCEKLLTVPKSNVHLYNENLAKATKMYRDLCLPGMMSTSLTPSDRLRALISFIKNIHDEGVDMLSRYRDLIGVNMHTEYSKSNAIITIDRENLVNTLVLITRCSDIDSYNRLYTAVTLFNNGYIDMCYDCFEYMACDTTMLIDHRVEACRYLYASCEDNYRRVSQEVLLEIIEDVKSYHSEYRYKIIAGFIFIKGINTVLNSRRIRVPYDEEFVYTLQNIFFYEKENDVRYRLLSGQHLLEMEECITAESKTEIANMILDIARDNSLEENTRADAADIVLRCGNEELRNIARQLIVDLGYSAVGTGKTLLDNIKTVYTNSQNVHEFSEQVDKFIEQIIHEKNIVPPPFETVHNQISQMLRGKDPKERFNALKALNRISIDTAKFSKLRVTLAEIFVHVWVRIHLYDNPEIVEELEGRITEELVEMGDTCSSGHAARFVNVLSAYDETLSISYEQQIIANVSGRLNALIRDCNNEKIQMAIAMATSPDPNEEDVVVYKEYIGKCLADIYKELYTEFVGGKFVTASQFEEYFNEAKRRVG